MGTSGTFGLVAKLSSRVIVGAFAGMRVAIGLAFALAPDRVGGRPESDGTSNDVLMARSFPVREIVLGVGGLLAVRRADTCPSGVRTWAGLGALTDAGDLVASLAGARRAPALVAATGLAAELGAFAGSRSRTA